MRIDFRITLTFIMILFAFTISITLATTNHFRLKEQAVAYEQSLLQQDIDKLLYALETSEKASALLGEDIARKMLDGTMRLQKLYAENPNIDEWPLSEWRNRLSFEIYLIDPDNVITRSTVPEDIGLDFNSCCRKLAKVLDERRAIGGFYHDGFDVEQSTGQIVKYSYMSTPDKQYIIQLGYAMQEGHIFQEFSFLNVIDQLLEQENAFLNIHILNTVGRPLGSDPDSHSLTREQKAALDHTLSTGEPTEIEMNWRGSPAKAQYILYSSVYDQGATQRKVLEIIYHEGKLRSVLNSQIRSFSLQLAIIFFAAIALSYMISRWIAKPMYLAFHDSLTGLKNRAAFEEVLQSTLLAGKGDTALFMIDLDHFKLVNDSLGHDRGDELLRDIAQVLRTITHGNQFCFRLGGDEFTIILPSTNREEIAITAEILLRSAERFTMIDEQGDLRVTLSIGIAIAPEHGVDEEMLRKHADIALYQSKQKGKNQYQIYDGGDILLS